jgi:hypothetical protein
MLILKIKNIKNYFNIFLNENHFYKVLYTTLRNILYVFNCWIKKQIIWKKNSLEKKIEEKDKKSFFC